MSKALEEVLKEVSKLPEAGQDTLLAEAIRTEIGTEKDWDRPFDNPSALYPAGALPRGVARSSPARLTAAGTREPGSSPGFRFTWDGGL